MTDNFVVKYARGTVWKVEDNVDKHSESVSTSILVGRRPVVIVSTDAVNTSFPYVTCCPITHRLRSEESIKYKYRLPIRIDDCNCEIATDQITTKDKTQFVTYLGKLPENVLHTLNTYLQQYLGSVEDTIQEGPTETEVAQAEYILNNLLMQIDEATSKLEMRKQELADIDTQIQDKSRCIANIAKIDIADEPEKAPKKHKPYNTPHRRYTSEEKQYILDNYSKETEQALCEKFGKTTDALYKTWWYLKSTANNPI